MKKLELLPSMERVDCKTESAISEGILATALRLPMMCGGNGRCATCHVYVISGAENLSPPSTREQTALGRLTGMKGNSRLACQAKMLGDVSVEVPAAHYIQSVSELELLIGTRAEKDLLAATDGRVVVRKGQIITKFIVTKMKTQAL